MGFGKRKRQPGTVGVLTRSTAADDTADAASDVLVTQLVLPQEAADSDEPYDVVQGAISFVNYMLETALFLPEEIIQQPIWSYQVDDYLAQVNNGGHGQYVCNSRWLPRSVKACARGLEAMGADDFADIYSDLVQFMESDSSRAEAVADGCRFGEIDPAISDLDDRFFALDGTDRLVRQNRDWLLSLPCVRLVPFSHWQREVQLIARANPMREERAIERQEARLGDEARDTHLILAKELCNQCDRTFIDWKVVEPNCQFLGQQTEGWFMTTDQGPAVAFYFGRVAALYDYEPAPQKPSEPGLEALKNVPTDLFHFGPGSRNSVMLAEVELAQA